MIYNVSVSWDDEAKVWCAICDDIPIALENQSFDILLKRVKSTVAEILELNGKITENAGLCFVTAHFEKIA